MSLDRRVQAGAQSVEREPKHTSGPWEVSDERTCEQNWFASIISFGPAEARGVQICMLTGGSPYRDGEGLANARLIAAGPDLLEACRFVKNFLDTLESGLGSDDPLSAGRQKFHAPLHARLDAAIAKATQERAALSNSSNPPATREANPQ